jgi:hypothetical protein
MGRLWRLALISGVSVLFGAQFAAACRYNVRDVGFVDLGVGSHYLFACVDGDTPEQLTGDLEDVLNLMLPDSTLYAEIIDVNDVPGHPVINLLKEHKVESYPTLLLASPEEQSRIVSVDQSGEGFKKNLTAALEDLLDSPKRTEILKHLANAYGVVLLIEGRNADDNAAARQTAEAAVKTIEMHMDYLPKPIEKPPVLLTLTQKELAAEDILLWSLGLDTEKIDAPHVVILYGRCRRLGPTLTGEDLTEDIVTNILSIIGADCECGLDRRWMQGAMVPVKWDEEIQSQLVKSLGFDPENPMVKMEMSMILRKGGGMAPGVYVSPAARPSATRRSRSNSKMFPSKTNPKSST